MFPNKIDIYFNLRPDNTKTDSNPINIINNHIYKRTLKWRYTFAIGILFAINCFSKWLNNPSEDKNQESQGQSDTVTFRRPHVLNRVKAQSLEDCLRNVQ